MKKVAAKTKRLSREKRHEIAAMLDAGMQPMEIAKSEKVPVKAVFSVVGWKKHVAEHSRTRIEQREFHDKATQAAMKGSLECLEGKAANEKVQNWWDTKGRVEILKGTNILQPDSSNLFINNLVMNCPADWRQKFIPATAEPVAEES